MNASTLLKSMISQIFSLHVTVWELPIDICSSMLMFFSFDTSMMYHWHMNGHNHWQSANISTELFMYISIGMTIAHSMNVCTDMHINSCSRLHSQPLHITRYNMPYEMYYTLSLPYVVHNMSYMSSLSIHVDGLLYLYDSLYHLLCTINYMYYTLYCWCHIPCNL